MIEIWTECTKFNMFNQNLIDRKKVKVETEKVNKLSTNIPTSNITELNELTFAEVKLVRDKISIP